MWRWPGRAHVPSPRARTCAGPLVGACADRYSSISHMRGPAARRMGRADSFIRDGMIAVRVGETRLPLGI
jgi:hypothetical protein